MTATETAAGTGTSSRRPRRAQRAAEPPVPPAGATTPPAAPATPPAGAAKTSGVADAPSQPAAPAASEGTPRERWLAAARSRFAEDPEKEPVTGEQLTYLLDLLHEEGKDRRLVSETYGYLDRGMSKAHASVQIRKLRGEFVERRAAA